MDQYNLFQKLRASLSGMPCKVLEMFDSSTIIDCSTAVSIAGDIFRQVNEIKRDKLETSFITLKTASQLEEEYLKMCNQRLPWDSCIFIFAGHETYHNVIVFAFTSEEIENTHCGKSVNKIVFFSAIDLSSRYNESYLLGGWGLSCLESGQFLCFSDINSIMADLHEDKVWRFVTPVKGSKRQTVYNILVGQVGHWCSYALELIHCKNVGVCPQERNESRPERRQRERALGVRTYKVLDLSKISNSYQSSNPGNASEYERSLHLCRGHFRTYTPEAPLFGRVVGRVWVPSHARGNREIGIVDKDYSLGEKELLANSPNI